LAVENKICLDPWFEANRLLIQTFDHDIKTLNLTCQFLFG